MKNRIVRGRGLDADCVLTLAEKPRHAEEYSTEESAKYQPWEVELAVQYDEVDPRTKGTYYYVRANHPGQAIMFAHKMFGQWEKADKGIGAFSRFPDPVAAKAKRLDEDEWKEAWACAKRHAHKKIGMEANPSCFTILEAVSI